MMSYGYYEMLFLMSECASFFFFGDSHIFFMESKPAYTHSKLDFQPVHGLCFGVLYEMLASTY